MKASQFFISTLKEAPCRRRGGQPRADDASRHDQAPGCRHLQLHAHGPAVIRKVEAIVREEMNRAGAVELLMPVVQPAGAVARDRPLRQDGP